MSAYKSVISLTWNCKPAESDSQDQEGNGNSFRVRESHHQQESGFHSKAWNTSMETHRFYIWITQYRRQLSEGKCSKYWNYSNKNIHLNSDRHIFIGRSWVTRPFCYDARLSISPSGLFLSLSFQNNHPKSYPTKAGFQIEFNHNYEQHQHKAVKYSKAAHYNLWKLLLFIIPKIVFQLHASCGPSSHNSPTKYIVISRSFFF